MDLALPTKTQVSCIVPLLLLPVTSHSDLDYKAGDVRSPLCIGPGSPDCDIGVLPLKKEQLLVEYGDIRIEYGILHFTVPSQVSLGSNIYSSAAWPNQFTSRHIITSFSLHFLSDTVCCHLPWHAATQLVVKFLNQVLSVATDFGQQLGYQFIPMFQLRFSAAFFLQY